MADPADPRSLSRRFRERRDQQLRALIESERSRVTGTFRIVDLGGGRAYWDRVGLRWLAERDIAITCINSEASELTRDATTGSCVSIAVGDACRLTDHADGSFHLVHSNSVIEHVGRWADMRAFAGEVRRLAPAYYVQTPYFWFPVDPHFHRLPFFHWLPASLRIKLLGRFRIGWSRPTRDMDRAAAMVESNTMLDRAQFRHLFPDGTLLWERFLAMRKSMIAIRRSRS